MRVLLDEYFFCVIMKNYRLKNFRVFDSEGAEFQFAPITALTGCNSSGKSSLTKSMMLLQPFFESIQNDIQNGNFEFAIRNLKNYKLDFTIGKHKLGNFEKVINWESSENEFIIEYTKELSCILWKPIDIQLIFVAEDISKSQNLKACLKDVVVKCEDKLFFSFENGFNIGLFKENLINSINAIDLSVLLNCIADDLNAEDVLGYSMADQYSYDDYTQVINWFGGNDSHFNNIVNINRKLESILGKLFKQFIKQFDNSNYKRNKEGKLDLSISSGKFDFDHGHVYPLYKLMDQLNDVEKSNFEQWCEDKFIKEHENEWYNTSGFKKIIAGFSHEFVTSDYNKFSDYYGALETEYLNGNIKDESGLWRIDSFTLGTCCEVCPSSNNMICGHNIFENDNFVWDELSYARKFGKLFEALQGWGGYSNVEPLGGPSIEFPLYKCIQTIAEFVVTEALINTDISKTNFLEIDRANLQRLYSLESQGTSFNKLLNDYYNIKQVIENTLSYPIIEPSFKKGQFIQKWLKKLTDFDDIEIDIAPEGVGYYVYLLKKEGEDVKQRMLTSDVGYGLTPLISMLLYIEILISSNFNSRGKCVLCIEEPESNLHPRLQSLLVDMLYDATKNYPIKFILETHSEYIIRKMQVLVAKEKYESKEILERECPFRVYYLPKGGKPYDLDFRIDGKFSRDFGSGFFDEASNLAFEIF